MAAAKKAVPSGKPTNMDEAVQCMRDLFPSAQHLEVTITEDGYTFRGQAEELVEVTRTVLRPVSKA